MNTKMSETIQKLEEGIKEVFTSGRWEEYLKFLTKFHQYSYSNVLLILSQMPNASRVASYNKWKELGRYVKKGEKGITILAPSFKNVYAAKRDENNHPMMDFYGNEIKSDTAVKTLTHFIGVSVFDVSQTDGEPLPEFASGISGEVKDYGYVLDSLIKYSPFEVKFTNTLPPTLKGCCNLVGRSILIKDNLSEVETISVLVHEIAHAKMHDTKNNFKASDKYNHGEIEAESCAYIVCSHLGIDCGTSNFEYIAAWSKDKEVTHLKNCLNLLTKEANSMIAHITDYVQQRTNEKAYAYER